MIMAKDTYISYTVSVAPAAQVPILAVGGEIKTSLCLLRDSEAVMARTNKVLSDPAGYRNYLETLAHLKRALDFEPGKVACDMHPEYTATRYAKTLNLPLVEIQHHHAHIVSCMVENGFCEPVIGLACDGTGFGTDGAIWGCEVLVCDLNGFSRAAHLGYFPLPGGDAVARDTWRPAAGLLYETLGESWLKETGDLFAGVDPEAVRLVAQRLQSSRQIPPTSSLGRFFDAAAFLLGLCSRNVQEAQAPRALEAAAHEGAASAVTLPVRMVDNTEPAAPMWIDFRPIVRMLLEGIRTQQPVADLAYSFHLTVAEALVLGARLEAERTGIQNVALSGGCFFNKFLLQEVKKGLTEADLNVLIHEQGSPGDESLALGQAVAASWMS